MDKDSPKAQTDAMTAGMQQDKSLPAAVSVTRSGDRRIADPIPEGAIEDLRVSGDRRRMDEHAAQIAEEQRLKTLARIREKTRLAEQQALAAHIEAEEEKAKSEAAERAAKGMAPKSAPASTKTFKKHDQLETYLIAFLLIAGSILFMVYGLGFFETGTPDTKAHAPTGDTKVAAMAPPAPETPNPAAAEKPATEASQTAAAPQPAVAAKQPAAPASPQGSEPEIRQSVTQWAEAWSRRDVAAYLASYGPDFKPAQGMSRPDWEAQRKSKLGKYKSIQVTLKDVKVDYSGGEAASVKFTQDFKGDGFKETGVKKELRLKKTQGRWLIISETAL